MAQWDCQVKHSPQYYSQLALSFWNLAQDKSHFFFFWQGRSGNLVISVWNQGLKAPHRRINAAGAQSKQSLQRTFSLGLNTQKLIPPGL